MVGYLTWKQAAKVYKERLAEKGVTGFRDAAGRDRNMKTYAEMVARSTVREAMIEGTSNRLLEHGHDMAKISGGTGENTCDKCAAWVGRIISLTGKTPGYPTIADARAVGVFHPRCTHTTSSAMTFEGEIAKAKYATDQERKVKAALAEGQSFWGTMDEFEQIAVKDYTDRDIGFRINNHLYNGAPASQDILDTIELMDQALQRASLPEDMILYRGVRPDIWQIMKADPGYITPGDEVVSKGFVSSTHDNTRAWKFASEKALKNDEIAVIEILAPKGTPALSLEAHSYSPSDKEILINRDTKFKVIEARKDGSIMRLIWEAMS